MRVIDHFKSTIYFYYKKHYHDSATAELKTKLFYTYYNDESLFSSIATDPGFSIIRDCYKAINPKEILIDNDQIINWLMSSPDKTLNEVQWLDICLFVEMFAPLFDDISKQIELAKFLLHIVRSELLPNEIDYFHTSKDELQNIETLSDYIKFCIEKTSIDVYKDNLDIVLRTYHIYIYEYANVKTYQNSISISYLRQNCSTFCTEYECPTKCSDFVNLDDIPEEFFIGYDFFKNQINYYYFTKLVNDCMHSTGASFSNACKKYKKFDTRPFHVDELFNALTRKMNSQIQPININESFSNIKFQEINQIEQNQKLFSF